MRLVERVDQAAVVAAFLRAELDSHRFGPALRDALARVGADDELITAPDLGDTAQNARRHAVLDDYRGGYLGTWFDELVWSRAELEPDEVLDIRYIAWDFWLEITDGSRLPSDGAEHFRAAGTELVYAPGPAPLIAIRAAPGERLVVVEGHVRLTALATTPDAIPRPLEVLLGEGAAVRRWGCY
jgi:hypothetical protein